MAEAGSAEYLNFAGALIDTSAGVAKSKRERKHQLKMLDKTAEYNRAEALRAQEASIDMWHMANKYNSPTEQMARLKAAGLNPNLAYGSGNVGGLSSSAPDGYKATQSPDYLNTSAGITAMEAINTGLSAYQDYRMKNAQIDSVQKMNALNGIELIYRDADLAHKTASSASKMYIDSLKVGMTENIARYQQDMLAAELQQKQSNVSKTRSQIDNVKAHTLALELENDVNSLLKPYGLTTRDDARTRQLLRIMSKDNPGISAIDAALLISSFLGK